MNSAFWASAPCPRVHCNDRYAAQVGVLHPSYNMGDTCHVEWRGGWVEELSTGQGDRFELVHVEVSPTSGAPVVADCWSGKAGKEVTSRRVYEQRWDTEEVVKRPRHLLLGPPWDMQGRDGVAVERGTHWTYGGPEPGVGTIRANSAQEQQAEHESGE